MKFLTAGMKELTTDEEKVAARLKMLMLGFRKVRGNNDKYAYTFCLLEVVNFVNVILQVIFISTISTLYLFQYLYILQIYVTDMFLHGKFLDYGSRLLSYYQVSTISTLYLLYLRNIYIYNIYQNYDVAWDPMDEVFPKMAKCQFNRHGPGGGIQVSIYYKYIDYL